MMHYGIYEWTCSKCGRHFQKNTEQGLAVAKSNHRRSCR